MFTTDFLFEGSPLERMQAKAKESIQPLVFLLEEPPLEMKPTKANEPNLPW